MILPPGTYGDSKGWGMGTKSALQCQRGKVPIQKSVEGVEQKVGENAGDICRWSRLEGLGRGPKDDGTPKRNEPILFLFLFLFVFFSLLLLLLLLSLLSDFQFHKTLSVCNRS